MKRDDLPIVENVELAAATTLGVGGAASFFVRCRNAGEAFGALGWARTRALPVFVLGGGSNVLVADEGFPGLVVQLADDGLRLRVLDEGVGEIEAGAAARWDDVVQLAVDSGHAGLEALSGIPGSSGAAPIQNIGAYGQEVGQTLAAVQVLERSSGELAWLPAADCGFGYRASHFKSSWRERYLVLAIRLHLRRQATTTASYPELRKRLGVAEGEAAALAEIRAAVLALRGEKAMLYAPGTPNGRSAGSFFLNPVVDVAIADRVAAAARKRGASRELPRFPSSAGVKLSAAWLIEEAGFHRGWGEGRASLSERHTLAIVNRGGATAADVLAVAGAVWRGVRAAFGIELEPEPVFLGFAQNPSRLLAGDPTP
jgi:UDP-N-acetylmuramate dehydrogenase